MIDQTTLITYLAILLGFVFIPGPAVIFTMARATTSGTKAGVATGLGIAIGDLVHTAMAVLGLSAIILTSAYLFTVIKYLGAAYLVYLGIRAFIQKVDFDSGMRVQAVAPGQALRQGILAEVLNPKAALFFLAFLPQFVNPANGSVALQLSILGVLFVLMGLFSTVVVSICAGEVSGYLRRNPSFMRWQNRVVGGIYCALGVRLALQEK